MESVRFNLGDTLKALNPSRTSGIFINGLPALSGSLSFAVTPEAFINSFRVPSEWAAIVKDFEYIAFKHKS